MDTPDQFMAKVHRLERLACPSEDDEALFHALMEQAKEHGLSYKDALEYTICMRNGGAD